MVAYNNEGKSFPTLNKYYRIALIFLGSKFFAIFMNDGICENISMTLCTIACFCSVLRIFFNKIVKNSNSRKLRPAKYKHYTICVYIILVALTTKNTIWKKFAGNNCFERKFPNYVHVHVCIL